MYSDFIEGHEAGWAEGYEEGRSEGFQEGYREGQTKEYSEGYIHGLENAIGRNDAHNKTLIDLLKRWRKG